MKPEGQREMVKRARMWPSAANISRDDISNFIWYVKRRSQCGNYCQTRALMLIGTREFSVQTAIDFGE